MGYREKGRMEIVALVRRWQAGEAERAIARQTGMGRATVSKYLAAPRRGGRWAPGSTGFNPSVGISALRTAHGPSVRSTLESREDAPGWHGRGSCEHRRLRRPGRRQAAELARVSVVKVPPRQEGYSDRSPASIAAREPRRSDPRGGRPLTSIAVVPSPAQTT